MKRTGRGGLRLRALLTDEDAVSPVIGVILMVAITVILAAVIGTFTLGLYEGGNEAAPVVDFDTEYDDANSKLTVTHVGGETVDANRLEWVEGEGDGAMSAATDFSGQISSGSQAVVQDVKSDEVVLLVWNTVDEKRSATIMQWDGPDA